MHPESTAPQLAPHQLQWLRMVDAYAERHAASPTELDSVACFRELMCSDGAAARRERTRGHLTGSAWLVSADGLRVLLTHHRKLGRWLQLGGHADGEVDLARVALREAEEESGLPHLTVEPDVFDLDRHWIPPRGTDAGHWHYDVRYVVRACGSEAFVVSEESHALAWRRIDDLVGDSACDASLRRMAAKWLARGARVTENT